MQFNQSDIASDILTSMLSVNGPLNIMGCACDRIFNVSPMYACGLQEVLSTFVISVCTHEDAWCVCVYVCLRVCSQSSKVGVQQGHQVLCVCMPACVCVCMCACVHVCVFFYVHVYA